MVQESTFSCDDTTNSMPEEMSYSRIPLLPLTRAEEPGATASLKRPRKRSDGQFSMPAVDPHPSVGQFQVDYNMHTVTRGKVIERMRATPGVPVRSLLLLQGGQPTFRGETDHEHQFRQDSTFQYLFGVREPDCWGTIDLATERATLYIPRLSQEYATWMGAILPPSYFQEVYKVDDVRYVDELATSVQENTPEKVYVSKGYNEDGGKWSEPPSTEGLEELDIDSSSTLYDAIVECRVIKTPEEIELLRFANDLSSEAHFEIMRRTRPGMHEFQLESIFKYWIYYHGGCRHVGYECICACGPNSSVLHYGHAGAPNDSAIRRSDMLLLDMGGEYHCYGADISCSFPASGKFTADQRMVFEAVRDIMLAVIDNMKPGVSWVAMHELSYRVGCELLKAAGLLQGSVDDMMEANVFAVFMPHGIGHLLGLDTHDVGGYPAGGRKRDPRPGYSSLRCVRDLAAGMVMTVEPGIYFIDHLLDSAFKDPNISQFLVVHEIERFRGFGGVRLEDNILVTVDGVENMSTCPRTVEDVEGVMSGKITNRRQLFKKH